MYPSAPPPFFFKLGRLTTLQHDYSFGIIAYLLSLHNNIFLSIQKRCQNHWRLYIIMLHIHTAAISALSQWFFVIRFTVLLDIPVKSAIITASPSLQCPAYPLLRLYLPGAIFDTFYLVWHVITPVSIIQKKSRIYNEIHMHYMNFSSPIKSAQRKTPSFPAYR